MYMYQFSIRDGYALSRRESSQLLACI